MKPATGHRWLRPWVARGLLAVLLGGGAATAVRGAEAPHGGRVSWGRMVTRGDWRIHSDRDPSLASFIRKQTTLNLDPTWYSVYPSSLTELCRFPLIYLKDLEYVPSQGELANIREYLERGGFLCIDPCIAHHNPEAFYRSNSRIVQQLIPDAEIVPLPETHPIYHCYFDVTEEDIFTPDMGTRAWWPHHGLFGVYHGGRMIAVLGLYGLECGWPQTPMRTSGCMKMIVNIYVYAMTQAAPPPAKIK